MNKKEYPKLDWLRRYVYRYGYGYGRYVRVRPCRMRCSRLENTRSHVSHYLNKNWISFKFSALQQRRNKTDELLSFLHTVCCLVLFPVMCKFVSVGVAVFVKPG